MKKSRIIAPAAAILVFSSAAAVTGTVAWFTANRLATVAVSNIQAVSTLGGLKAWAEVGVNSSNPTPNSAEGASDTLSIEAGYLRDASYDMANDQLYYGTGVDVDGNTNVFKATDNVKETVKVNNVDTDVYFATTFTIHLVLSGSEDSKYDIFFSPANSTFALSSGTDKLGKAFRIAFNDTLVWAPKQTGSEVTYVNSVSTTATYTTATNCAIGNQPANTTTANTATQAAANKTRLVNEQAGGSTFDVVVTMWFEGSDPDCLTENIPEAAYSSSLQFYAINTADYAA